jgi:dephospho-CoA kinase
MSKLVVGLTGILGCGKSTASKILGECGAAIVDMDEAGRWVVENDASVRENIRATFGDSVFDQDGQLLRKKLGRIVFSSKTQLNKLNAIVHPAMLNRVRFLINKEKKSASSHYIIVDAALIYELNFDRECDITVCLTAPLEICLQRAESKGLTKEQALDRIHSQLPQEEKAARSGYVIHNDSTLKDFQKRLKELHEWLLNKSKE